MEETKKRELLKKVNFFLEGNIEKKNFIGRVRVNRVYDENNGRDLKVYFVTFYAGARTRLHYHDSDQVLIAKEGEGIVELVTSIKQGSVHNNDNDLYIEHKDRKIIQEGESVLIPAGKMHLHGGTKGSPKFSHISILRTGKSEWF